MQIKRNKFKKNMRFNLATLEALQDNRRAEI